MNNKTVNVICPLDIDEMNAMLQQHGLHIAPLPAVHAPPQTEAERLVEMANRLPQEVLGDDRDDPKAGGFWRLEDSGCVYFTRVDPRVINGSWGERQFRRYILGVMAAYVGTDSGACVWRAKDSVSPLWRWDLPPSPYANDAADLLTAYVDCCLAIHERRSSNG